MYGCESWTIKLSAKELMLLNCGVGKVVSVILDVDNLISGSSAFSKSSLNIWKFKGTVEA